MEGSTMQYPPGDPRMIDTIVYQLKSQGIFDQFRKECIADVDTKPAYQNLHQRVEGTVSGFLSHQVWRPDLNKNQLRESLRKHIHESGFLDMGVERIVDQVVNPKIMTVLVPQVEDVVYKFIGLEKPKKSSDSPFSFPPPTFNMNNIEPQEKKREVSLTDLLPKDLDPISPESDATKKSDNSFEDGELNDAIDGDEEISPPFESLTKGEVMSENSNLSGISGLTSPDGNHSNISFTGEKSPKHTSFENQISKTSLDSLSSISAQELPAAQKVEEFSDLNFYSTRDRSHNLLLITANQAINRDIQPLVQGVTTKVLDDDADSSSSSSSNSSSDSSSSSDEDGSSPGLGTMSESSNGPFNESMEVVEPQLAKQENNSDKITASTAEKPAEKPIVQFVDSEMSRNESGPKLKVDAHILEKQPKQLDVDVKAKEQKEVIREEKPKPLDVDFKTMEQKEVIREEKPKQLDSEVRTKEQKDVIREEKPKQLDTEVRTKEQKEVIREEKPKQLDVEVKAKEQKEVIREEKTHSRKEREDTNTVKRGKEEKSHKSGRKDDVVEKNAEKEMKDIKDVGLPLPVTVNVWDTVESSATASESKEVKKTKEDKPAKKEDRHRLSSKNGDKSESSHRRDDKSLKHRDGKSSSHEHKEAKVDKNGDKSDSRGIKKEHRDVSVKSEHTDRSSGKKDDKGDKFEKKNELKKEDKHSSDSNHSSTESHRRSGHSSHRSSKDRQQRKHSESEKVRGKDEKPCIEDKSKSDDKHKTSKEKGDVKEKSKIDDKSSSKEKDKRVEKDSSKNSADKHSRERKDSKSKSSSSKSKETTIKKKEKSKPTDDHDKHREKRQPDDRRSTDRDSNGTAHDRSTSATHTATSSAKDTQRKEAKTTSSGGKSGSGGNTDQSESSHGSKHSSKHSKSKDTSKEKKEEYFCTSEEGQLKLKIKMPKIAANIFEVQKIINMRKSLARLEQQRQEELDKAQQEAEESLQEVNDTSNPVPMEQTKEDPESDAEDVLFLDQNVEESQRFIDLIHRIGRSRTLSEISVSTVDSNDLDSLSDDNELEDLPLHADQVASSSVVKVLPVDTSVSAETQSATGVIPCAADDRSRSNTAEQHTSGLKIATISIRRIDGNTSTEMKPPKNSPSLNDKRETRRSRKPNMKYSSDDYSFEDFEGLEVEKKAMKRAGSVMAKPSPKKQKINHMQETSLTIADVEVEDNNNKNEELTPASDSSVDVAPAKVIRLGPSRRVGLVRPKTQPTSRVSTPDFVMPLSPESDVSASSADLAKKNALVPSPSTSEEDAPSILANSDIRKNQRRLGTPATASKGQRYSSDDLYKPRPLFSRLTRRNRSGPVGAEGTAENDVEPHEATIVAPSPIPLKRQR